MVEETEQLVEVNEEAEIAAEALAATEEAAPEVPAVVEPDPKDAVIGQFRRELRQTREELEQLKVANKPVEKSPLELAAEAQGVSVDDVEVTGRVLRAEQQFQNRRLTAQNEEQTYARQKREYDAGLSTVPQTELDKLVNIGGHLLTEGDKRNAWDAGKNSGKELVRTLKFRIEEAGLQPKPKAIVKPKDEPKKKEEVVVPDDEDNEKFDPIVEAAFKLFK